jgi:hypothetical protein
MALSGEASLHPCRARGHRARGRRRVTRGGGGGGGGRVGVTAVGSLPSEPSTLKTANAMMRVRWRPGAGHHAHELGLDEVLVGEALDLIGHAHAAPDEDERDEALREDVASSLTGAAEAG